MTKWTEKAAPAEQPGPVPELSAYQQALRDRFLAAPVVPAPEPWQPVFEYEYGVPVGGLLGIGFASHPTSGHDLVMVFGPRRGDDLQSPTVRGGGLRTDPCHRDEQRSVPVDTQDGPWPQQQR